MSLDPTGIQDGVCVLGRMLTCDLHAVKGLTEQILTVMNEAGYHLQQLDPEEFNCVNQATCYLQAEAADALAEASETPIVLESAWRSPAEQYVVMHWNQHGVCGVTKPAKPGSSLFNTGYAVDFGTTTPFNQTLETNGWQTDFEYVTTAVYGGLQDWSKPALIAF